MSLLYWLFNISFWPQRPGNAPLGILESWPCSTDTHTTNIKRNPEMSLLYWLFNISFWPQRPGNAPLGVLESWPCSTDKRRLWRYRASIGWLTSSAATTSWGSPQEVNWTPTTLSLPTTCLSESRRRVWRDMRGSEQRPVVCKRSVT